jgi:hypothetical protein
LDLAAHESLFSDICYREETIAPRSHKLGLHLLKIIELLVPEVCEDVPVFNALREIFTQAMELKSKLIISTMQYSIILFPSGTAFDENFMQLQTTIDKQNSTPPKADAAIKICILPAIFLSSTENQGLVQYRLNSFTSIDHLKGQELVSKSVVIL